MKIRSAAHQHAKPLGQRLVDAARLRASDPSDTPRSRPGRDRPAARSIRRAWSRPDARSTPRRRASWMMSTTAAGLGPVRGTNAGRPVASHLLERVLHRRHVSGRAPAPAPPAAVPPKSPAAPRPQAAPPRRRSACRAPPAARRSRGRAPPAGHAVLREPCKRRARPDRKNSPACARRGPHRPRDLDAGHDADVRGPRRGGDLGNRRDRVVIGHADGGEAGGRGARHQLRRRQPAVRSSRVKVKVDQRAGGALDARACARGFVPACARRRAAA